MSANLKILAALLAGFIIISGLSSCGGGGGGGSPSGRTEMTMMPGTPPMPTGLTARPSESGVDGAVDLSWDAVVGATGYKIYRGNTLITTIGSGTTTSYIDNDPGAGTDSYRIAASNASGDSDRSSAVVATMPAETPADLDAMPSGSGASGQVVLTWAASAGATGYKIYHAVGGTGLTLLHTITGGDTTTWMHLNTGAGEHSYQIAASNDGGDSDRSSAVLAEIPMDVPGAPTGFMAMPSGSGTDGDVDLLWDARTDATGYKIYRGNMLITTIGNGTTTSYTDDNPGVGTHSYQIAASNAGGDSDRSSAVLATVPAATPTGLDATPSGVGASGRVVLIWTALGGATGYKIYHAVGGTGLTLLETISGGNTATWTHLNAGAGTHSYAIAAVTAGAADSPQSSPPAQATVPAATPSGLDATPSGVGASGQVVLTWMASTGATGYKIYHAVGGAGLTLLHTISGGETATWMHSNTGAGEHSYAIAAVTAGAADSAQSSPAVLAMVPLAPPLGLDATPLGSGASGQVVLTWDALAGATGYKIYHAVGGAELTLLHTITGGETATWMHQNAGTGTHSYAIAAVKAGLPDSAQSSPPVSATILKISVCDRTQQVRDELVELSPVSDCADVTAAHLARIGELDLRDDGISALSAGDFSGLSSLVTLYLFDNDLTSLPADVFSGLGSLEELWLHGNDLASLPAEVFSGLGNLEELSLYNNDLASLPGDVFSGLGSLEHLDLEDNDLASLPAGVFSGLDSLKELWLHGNDLASLPAGVFSGLGSLENLRLDDNPNSGDSLDLTLRLARTDRDDGAAGPASVRVELAEGAPFDVVVGLSATGGNLSAPTATIPAGALHSESIAVTYTAGAQISISATPGALPAKHSGYQFVAGPGLDLGAPPSPDPDLVVESPSASDTSPTTGGSFTFSASVRNLGGAAAATTLRYYLSNDSTIETTDTEVGTADLIAELAADGTSAQSTSITAPSTARTYYYGACVVDVVSESNTNNNCSTGVRVEVGGSTSPATQVVEFSVSPNSIDLTPSAFIPPPPSARGDLVFTIRLNGVASSNLEFTFVGRSVEPSGSSFCSPAPDGTYVCRGGDAPLASITVLSGESERTVTRQTSVLSSSVARKLRFTITPPAGISASGQNTVEVIIN